MTNERAPSRPLVIPPLVEHDELGPLVVVDSECQYLPEKRLSRTAFALPERIDGAGYQLAMDLGMRRSGTMVYRPLCEGCRKCQPLRVRSADFVPSRSQRRVQRRCDGLFAISVGPPTLDDEHLALYRRYQEGQHGEEGQSSDALSYRRFLVDSITDTIEISWRDGSGELCAVSILDVTPQALSSVYFYWAPELAKLSLGVYSVLVEIDLARRWGKPWYYLGYLVPGSRTMSYKADFSASEVWNGIGWSTLPKRGIADPEVDDDLQVAEASAMAADAHRFRVAAGRPLEVLPEDEDATEAEDSEEF